MKLLRKATEIKKSLIIAVGNAPTALIELDELIKSGEISPDLIIGVPVGFVNVLLYLVSPREEE